MGEKVTRLYRDKRTIIVHRSYLLQLHWAGFTKAEKPELKTLEERPKTTGGGKERRIDSHINRSQNDGDIYTGGDIGGSENKGGAVMAADYVEVCP